MNKFIQLTVKNEKRYFNVANIVFIRAEWNGKAIISMSDGYFYEVEEDLNTVLKMIGVKGA